MRKCAYCQQPSPGTGEHIISRCLIDQNEGGALRHPRAGGNFVNPNQKINDVCNTCNNERLNETDNEICNLHKKYFSKWIEKGEEVEFEYDFEKLSRWLLKTAYNGMRAGGELEEYENLKEMRKYMIGRKKPNKPISIFLLLITPTNLKGNKEETIEKFDIRGNKNMIGKGGTLKPKLIEMGKFHFRQEIDKDFSDQFESYICIINSYVFFTVIHSEVMFRAKREMKRIKEGFGKIKRLGRSNRSNITSSGIDFAKAAKIFGFF